MSDSTPDITQIMSAQSGKEIIANRNINASFTMFGIDKIVGSTLYYFGGRFGGTHVNAGTVSLGYSATHYVVAKRADLTVSASTGTTNWNDNATYGRIAKVVMGASAYTSWEDHRFGNAEAIFPMMAGGGGGGGGGGGMTLIEKVTLSSSASTIASSVSIPGVYNNLKLQLVGKDTNTGAGSYPCKMMINGDTTSSNYTVSQQLSYSSSAMSQGEISPTSSGSTIAQIGGGGGGGVYVGISEIIIPMYASTSYYKICQSRCTAYRNATPGVIDAVQYAFVWKNTSAITSVAITAGGTSFAAGATLCIYGY